MAQQVDKKRRTQGSMEIRTAGKTPSPCVFTSDNVPVARFERVGDAVFFLAASDLLETLKLFVDTCSGHVYGCDGHECGPRCIATRAALAKAEETK